MATVAEQWFQKGKTKGKTEGNLIGQILMAQRILRQEIHCNFAKEG